MMSRLKTTAGAAIVAGLVAIPVVATAAPYQPAVQTSTTFTNPDPMVTYGSQPQVTATVSGVAGTNAPTGTITFTITPGVDGTSPNTTTGPVTVSPVGANDAKAVYTFPATTPANTTYSVSAAFTSTNPNYNNSSTSVNTNVTIFKATPTVTHSVASVNSQKDRITVTLAGPAGTAAPTGSVTVSYTANGTSGTATGTLSGGSFTTGNLNEPAVFVSVTYVGNGNYNALP